MALTVQEVKNAKSDPSRTLKLFDGGGLFLEVTPTGSKRWRLKYRFKGKEKLISLGLYPVVGLKDAREARDEAKRQLAKGIDPSAHRQAEKASSTFQETNSLEFVAREWLAQNQGAWVPSHGIRIKQRLENDVFPFLGKAMVADISPSMILEVLRRIESREAFETAHRVRTNLSQTFRFAIATGRMSSDPTRDLRGALRPVKTTHLAAITEPARVGELLRLIDGYRGGVVVTTALKVAPLVFVRPGELRRAEWADIDLEAAEWRFIVQKTKTPHIVPLSRQAVAALRDLYPITGGGKFVFPSPRSRDRPMSENAVLAALRSLGIPKEEMCGHGFRAMARTILDEVLGFPPHLIEHQLAHSVRDALGRAYNRTKHLTERKEMMQKWANYLQSLRERNEKGN
jgi:integrase